MEAAVASQQQAFSVVTYNILSSALASPDWFCHCDPLDLVAETRLTRVLAKLALHTDRRAIICLQEVSRDWSGKLHTFFHQRKYTFIDSLYSGSSSGYMGVGMAFPSDVWSLKDVDIRRVSETKAEWHLPSREWRPARGQVREGDWTCPNPACRANVFASKVECYKCRTPKPKPETPKPEADAPEDTPWEPVGGIKALWAWLSRAMPTSPTGEPPPPEGAAARSSEPPEGAAARSSELAEGAAARSSELPPPPAAPVPCAPEEELAWYIHAYIHTHAYP